MSKFDELYNSILKEALGEKKWYEKYIPYGYFHGGKYELGTTEDGREFVTWIIPDEGEMTYNYYVVYKDEGKEHWIDREEYEALMSKSLAKGK